MAGMADDLPIKAGVSTVAFSAIADIGRHRGIVANDRYVELA